MAEERNERALAERVGDGGVEGEGRVFAREELNPASLRRVSDKIQRKDCKNKCNVSKPEKENRDVCPKTKQSFTLARAERRLKIATQNRDRLSSLRRPDNKTLPDLGGRDIDLPLS